MFKSIDQLDKAIGGDPYLNNLRAGGLMEAGRYKEASAAAEMAVKAVPKLPQAYWMRATIATKEKNNADVLAWFKRLIEATETEVVPADLETDERFVGFVKSPEFGELKAWLAKRPK
jgi:predicted Zn-dependent protease